ncbi:MAG TPA: hypothetical protein VEP46_00745, partial [Vicinamibacterales bacterium]|nr:hypothetical protein [Vicinamibacterales bacterium]
MTEEVTVIPAMVGAALALWFSAAPHAQARRPTAEVTPLVERAVRAGEAARVAIRVALPEGLHTQSNKPRDETLIPTEVTV